MKVSILLRVRLNLGTANASPAVRQAGNIPLSLLSAVVSLVNSRVRALSLANN